MKKHIYFTGIWIAVVLLAMIVACNPPKEEDTEPIAKPLSELARVNGIGFQQTPRGMSPPIVRCRPQQICHPNVGLCGRKGSMPVEAVLWATVMDVAYAPSPNNSTIFATTIHEPSLRRTMLSEVLP